MSYISDWKNGYISDEEFEQCGVEENNRERAYYNEVNYEYEDENDE